MGNAVDSIGRIEKNVMASAGVVKKLGEDSRQIGQIVETIAAISRQTNLLALNAAIEAAAIVKMVDSIDEISKKTADNMKSISASTEEQSASNEEIAAASQALSKMTEDMQDAVGQFKV